MSDSILEQKREVYLKPFHDAFESDGHPLASPSSGNPSDISLSCQTFRVTISPVTDVTDFTIDQIVRWLKKQKFGFAVTERGKNGKLHVHMCVCTHKPIDRQNLHDSWWKRIRNDYEGSLGRIAVRVDIMYDHKWYNEYLRKEEDAVVIYDSYNSDAITELFPTQQQQERYTELKGQPVFREHLYDIISNEFKEYANKNCRSGYAPDLSAEAAAKYLKYRQHVLKKQPYITDNRRFNQLAYWIYEHVNAVCECDFETKKYFNDRIGNFVVL